MKVSILCLIALFEFSLYVESVVVDCEFKDDASLGYYCGVKTLNISSKDDRTITEVTGEHFSGKTNSDVKTFYSDHQIVKFCPLGLATFFTNLKSFRINAATLSEIHSSDLKQFGDKLTGIHMGNNLIEILEADLFQFNPNLDHISFFNNKMRHVDDGTFRGLPKLTHLRLNGGNICINKHATARSTVIPLITEIELKCKDFAFVRSKNHQEVSQVQLDELNAKISQQNATILEMKAQLDEMRTINQEMSVKIIECEGRIP